MAIVIDFPFWAQRIQTTELFGGNMTGCFDFVGAPGLLSAGDRKRLPSAKFDHSSSAEKWLSSCCLGELAYASHMEHHGSDLSNCHDRRP